MIDSLAYREQCVVLLNSGLGDKMVTSNTDNVLNSFNPAEEDTTGKVILFIDIGFCRVQVIHYIAICR
jgi:hypothetical protein